MLNKRGGEYSHPYIALALYSLAIKYKAMARDGGASGWVHCYICLPVCSARTLRVAPLSQFTPVDSRAKLE